MSARHQQNHILHDLPNRETNVPAGAPLPGKAHHQEVVRRLETHPRGVSVEDEPLSTAWIEGIETRVGYIYDFEKNAFIEHGEKLAAIYGYTPAEIAALPEGWDSLIHTDDIATVKEGRDALFTGEISTVTAQMRIACKDGRWEWIQHDWRALERNAKGMMTQTLGLVQIITPLALATQALRNEVSLNALCRTLVEEWVDGIFLVDEKWHILFANQGALDVLGYTQAELHTRPISHVLHMDLGKKKEPALPKITQKLTLRGSHLPKDGNRNKVEIVIRRLPGERLLVTTRDIREQLAAEEYTRRQAAYYRGLFENNPSGVAVYDTTLQITKVNSALRRMLGFTEKQLIQMRVPDLLEAQNRPPDEFWKHVIDVSSKQPRKDIEVTLRSREGKGLYAHVAATFLPDTHTEAGQGIIIFTDISARRQAEQDLKKQSQLNDTLLRESAAMIGMVDLQGRIQKVNPAVEKISGYTAKELVGKTIWDCGLIDPEETPRVIERLKKLQDGAPRVTAISRARTKSGELRILQVHNTATRNVHHEVEGFIITAIDITEQQRLQHHLMEAIEQEQARIGHDLHDGVGQILTGIGALVEMLQARLSGNDESDAARIHELVRQAIQQVRQLSRNMSPAAIQHRDLAASLQLLADTVQTSFRRECEFHSELDVKIDDPTQSTHLFRIAQEAINNAMRHGSPQKISIRLGQVPPNHAVMEITNDGKAFDCRPGSEGIGLRVMNYRASLIHADFSVACPPTGGVKVTCQFPLLPSGDTPQATTKHKQKYKP